MSAETVHGYPSKTFFVDMLTRDIKASDSILDLMDNSIDSAVTARRLDVMRILEGKTVGEGLTGYHVLIDYSDGGFRLRDNCGGISVRDAQDRVFLLGNPRAAGSKKGLSVYGIGMKRAFFKLGNNIRVDSQTEDEFFTLDIDVSEWHAKGDQDWDFAFTKTGPARPSRDPGTQIEIKNLHAEVARLLALRSFQEDLEARIASTYALFVEAGLQVKVNRKTVRSSLPELGGQNTTPARQEFTVDGVKVMVIAGVTPRSDRVQRGTYVFCNGRMVLEADRSGLTGWGDLLPQWHTKFGHFVGYLYFEADDLTLLPWTTTKQGVVFESAVYQRALRELQVQARPVLNFLTRLYPGDVEEEGIAEREALDKVRSVKISELRPGNSVFHVEVPKQAAGQREVNILFTKKVSDVDRIKKCFPRLKSAKAIGSYAFDYFLKRECDQ